MIMFWDEELDFSLKSKAPAKKGRRATNKASIDSTFQLESEDNPPQTKKFGGWAEEIVKGKKNKNSNILEQQRFTTEYSKEEIHDNIPEIPDSDDFTDSLPDNVAAAPSVAVNRTETYSQINRELMKNSSTNILANSDYSILTEFLANEEQLKPLLIDKPLTFETLFVELSEDYYKSVQK